MTTQRIIGIGAATMDHLFIVPEFPCGEGVTRASRAVRMGGGPVATALCVLSQLGHDAELLDLRGDDATGLAIRDELERHGVKTTHMLEIGAATSAHASILVRQSDGARHITFSPSSAGDLPVEAVKEQCFHGATLLHVNGRHESACRRAVEFARRHGVTISFDGGAGRYRDSVRDLVLASQVRILSREFAEKFTGETDLQIIADSMQDEMCELLVITDGVRGSHVWSKRGESFHQPAFPATPLVDTTGCGDVFHGAFLHGWLREWDVRRTAEFASRLAARNAEGLGGRFVLETET
jgi:sulfofructose kinase